MAFLRNCWYAAMWEQDLPVGKMIARTLLGEPLVFYRNPTGAPVALVDICPHRFAPLHLGRLLPQGGVACGYHGLEFSDDGRCNHNPHEDRIPSSCRVRSYPVVARDSMLWIWMGDAAADPSLIPDYFFLDPANGFQVVPRDHLHMPVDYRLIIANLLDLSHVSFLHEGILGNTETAKAKIDVTTAPGRVEVSRFSRNVPPPEMFDLLFRADGERVDIWNSMLWQSPSNMRNDAGVCPPDGDRADGAGILSAHILTPETETSTFYFIAAARQKTRFVSPSAPEEIRAKLAELRRIAFEMQDAPMIKAQQQMIENYPHQTRRPAFLAIDAAPAQAQTMLKKQIEDEQAALSGAAESGP